MWLAQTTLISGWKCVSRVSKLILNASISTSSTRIQDEKVHWRESATLIIANLTPRAIEFLFTKRADHAKILGGFWCYPGGASSSADSSSEWLDLFQRFGEVDRITKFKCLGERARIPEMYSSKLRSPMSGRDGGFLAKEIALRLTVIRETFEECGLLLCRPATEVTDGLARLAALPNDVLLQYQARVKANPAEFPKLCAELEVLPCFEDLYEWSNWLTPTSSQSGRDGVPRRFDVISYMAILPPGTKQPKIVVDPDEVTDYKWVSAQDLIKENTEEAAAVDLPQLLPNYLYEMAALRSATNVDHLKALLRIRQEMGILRLCPLNIQASDGVLSCMLGDDLFPKSYDLHQFTEIERVEKTLEELEKSCKNLHRWQVARDGTYKLLANTSEFREMYPTNASITVARAKTYIVDDILQIFIKLN